MMQMQHAKGVAQALAAMVQASVLSSADASRLTALVQSNQQADDSEDALGAPAAAVYTSHSGGIVDTLSDLLEKAQTQLADARKQEMNSLHNFEMLRQSLVDEIKFANSDLASANKGLSENGEKKATAEGDLAATTKGVNENTKALGDLEQDCSTKASDHDAETKSRAEELKALAVAKKAITDNTAGANDLSYGFSQTSFLQLGRSQLASGTDLAKFEAVRFVRDLAHKTNAPELVQLSLRMASAMRFGWR